jgi:hypothetical protein
MPRRTLARLGHTSAFFICTNPTDEPITFGLPVRKCLLEAADRVPYQMRRNVGGTVTAAVTFNSRLGGVPGHCVSITHVPFSRSPHGGVWSVRPPVDRFE